MQILLLILLIPALIFFISPLLAFFTTLFISSIYAIPKLTLTEGRGLFFLISILSIVSLAVFTASFELFGTSGHDFASYYNNYIFILEGRDYSQWFAYGGGIEFGLPILNYLISLLVDAPKPFMVFFIHSLLFNALFVLLVSKLCKYEQVSGSRVILLLILSFLYFRFYTNLNAIRQGYSSFFILFAFFSSAKSMRLFWLVIASIFHLSAIPVYFLLRYVMQINAKNFYQNVSKIFIFFTLLIISIYVLLNFTITSVLSDKLVFLVKNLTNEAMISMTVSAALKINACYLVAFVLSLNSDDKGLKFKLLILMVLTTLASPFSTFLRLLYPFSNFLQGYFIYKALSGKSKLLSIFVIVISIIISVGLLIRNPMYNSSFPVVGDSPLYFIDVLESEQGQVNRKEL